MRNNTFPAVIYYPLQDISTKNELEIISTLAKDSLDKGHIASIINAFYINTRICRNGIPYIRAKGLASILRTGNSGAERPLIYQGIPGVLAPSAIIEIDGEYIDFKERECKDFFNDNFDNIVICKEYFYL